MKLYLRDEFKNTWPDEHIAFSEIMRFSGEVFREVETRKTERVHKNDRYYFIKKHFGVGWREILKCLLQGRLPILSARNEWDALQHLNQKGIPAPSIAAYGLQGRWPNQLVSFILMDALPNTKSLNNLAIEWKETPPRFVLKNKLITLLAQTVRGMHRSGLNHRDCYILHFHLDQSILADLPKNEDIKLYVIDLHRAQIRKKIPRRWMIKDLAGLYFSSYDVGLTRRDYFRFMKEYSQTSLREIFHKESDLWETVREKGINLYRKILRSR